MNEIISYLIIANIMFAIYSLTGVLGKYAAAENELTVRFIMREVTDICASMVSPERFSTRTIIA